MHIVNCQLSAVAIFSSHHALAVAALGPPLDRVPLNRPKWLEASAMRVIWHFAELRS